MKKLIAILVGLALMVSACSSSDDDDATTTTEDSGTSTVTSQNGDTTSSSGTTTSTTDGDVDATQFVDVYFVQGNGYATSVATAVPVGPDVAANAIRALIAGPTDAQAGAGLGSSVPTDTELLGLTIDDAIARVDFSRAFEAGGGTFSMTSRLAQVVYTLTAFSTIDAVEFWLEGEPVTEFSGEGLLLDGPVAREDVLASLPLSPTLDSVERWEQADLPDVSGFVQTVRVVLVAEDDVLNVRLAAGADKELIGMLAPGTEIALTGPRTDVGSSTWIEIVTPAGAGWVNGHFLAEVVDDDDFAADARVPAVLDRMTEIIDARGELSEVTSARGLYVSHHADPVRFGPDQMATVLTDTTTYKWPSNAINMDDPDAVAQEVPDRTFVEAIGDSFASTWDDPDRATAADVPLAGGNGRLPEDALPPKLAGFHFLSVHDSGDDPQFSGLDWTSWHVSIDYEDGAPVVVALTIDQWAP